MEKNDLVYTYLMRDGSNCKIGKSKNPEQRLSAMKTSRPGLKLVCYSRKYSEKHMHKRYKKYNIGGEWFRFTDNFYWRAVKDIATDEQYNKEKNDYIIKQKKKQKNKKKKQQLNNLEKSRTDYKNYVVDFGPYKGTRLIDMIDEKQVRFIKSCLKNSKTNGYRRKALGWWLNYLDELREIQKLQKNKA